MENCAELDEAEVIVTKGLLRLKGSEMAHILIGRGVLLQLSSTQYGRRKEIWLFMAERKMRTSRRLLRLIRLRQMQGVFRQRRIETTIALSG